MSMDKKEVISYSFEYDTAPQPIFRPILKPRGEVWINHQDLFRGQNLMLSSC
ncbi:hypothetical protein PISMIDRAFT_686881 [Pisolithus microcarpus 441]|uniref:Unplaced genomic scaffold scaffold_188, whole genome shotgun sequence n=1 Tax=Pisolithus microcarpus 441 TaxID=765257 RepID=A0A0C9XU81_9AGAM|nr:hypothetical protein PISMIDRAFT_686881 [Pisolithus microcarpus 441]